MDRLVPPLVTRRLSLVPCSHEAAQAAIADRAHLHSILRFDVPEDWPDEDLRDFLPIYARQLEADPDLLGWGIWLIRQSEQQTLVGSIGFKGKPEHGAVEIGYGIVPAHRQRGYATEAAHVLVAWAFRQPGVNKVLAECDRANPASIRVLTKLGMQRVGEEGNLLRWELLPLAGDLTT